MTAQPQDEGQFQLVAETPAPPREEEYYGLVAKALGVCAAYKPMFGKGRTGAMSLDEFQAAYGADPLYSWVGLNSPLMYAAHKAAGGMTSVYRQLGIGCQWVFNKILQHQLGLSKEQANWKYKVPGKKKPRTLSLDGRIESSNITNLEVRARVDSWLQSVHDQLLIEADVRQTIRGVVFEVRQGYKSKDSKRQNADIGNASSAYANLYVPVLMLFSTQIDGDCASRYVKERWLLMRGTTTGSTTESTYTFCRDVLGYDLAGFFQRNSSRFRTELEKVLKALLGAS